MRATSFQLHRIEPVEEAVRRIAIEQIDHAIASIERSEDDIDAAVHEVRQRCKRLRALIRLVRSCFGDYGAQNVWIRDTADVLSRARDSAVMPKTHSLVSAELGGRTDNRALAEMLLAMQQGSNLQPLSTGDLTVELEGVRKRLLAARQTVPGWSLDDTGFDAVRYGLHKTYARSQRAMIKVVESFRPARCHEWRKRVKYHGHHMRLLREIWPSEMSARESVADRLGDLLGALHDLEVYRTVLGKTPDLIESEQWGQRLSISADRLEAGLFAECEPLGERLFGAVPDDFVGQVGAHWEAWSEASSGRKQC